MDFDPEWRNREEDSSIQWKSTQQYLPSYVDFKSHRNLYSNLEHSDSTYLTKGELSNQSHFPYSPEHQRYFNYSPQLHLSTEMNRNMKYPSYTHKTLRCNDNSTCNSCCQFHRDIRLNTELDAKKYYSQACQHQLVNMCTDPYLGNNYTMKTNQKALNVKKRKKQCNESGKRVKAVDSLNKTVNYTYEELIINSNTPIQNCSSKSKHPTPLLPVCHDSATSIDPFIKIFNRQQFSLDDETHSVGKEHFSNIYSSNNTHLKVEDFDKILSTSAEVGNNNKPTKEDIFVNNELEASDIVHMNIKTDIIGRNAEYSDRADVPVKEIPDVTTENAYIQAKDSTHLEDCFDNVILQPIFEGKDENGEDVIVLLASSAINQEIPQKNYNILITEYINPEMTDSSVENKELISLDKTHFNTSAEFQTEEDPCPGDEINTQQNVLNKTLNENYKEHGLQIEGTDIFFSNINDFISEEAEVAIKNKPLNKKKTKKIESQQAGNTPLEKRLSEPKVYDNLLPENDLKTTEFEKKLNVPNTSLIRNRKKMKTSYKPSKFKRKRNYKSKSKKQLKNFKNIFLSEIVKLFQIRDISINHTKTWELLKNQICCGVLQSIFTTVQQLAKSEIQKSRSTISKEK